MPLHGKVPFKRKIPKGVAHLDQELFYCKPTKEVFTSYEELFERAIECSSLVWTCSLSGRGGLTFQEALDSEEKARKCLQAIPLQLKRLLLTQVDRCKVSRLQDLSEKVYSLVQNRFVLGETVEVTVHGLRRTCEITDVRPPGSSTKVKTPTKSPGKKSNESPKKASPSKIRYEVTEKESDIEVLHIVSPDCLSRPKGALSKDKTKLFLKQCVETQDGVLRVKNSLTQKYQLEKESTGPPSSKKARLEKPAKTSPVKTAKTSKPVTPNKASSVKNALKNSQSPSKLKKTLKSIDADIRKMFPKNSKLSPQSKENNPVPPVNGKTVREIKLEENKKKKLDLKEKRKSEAKLLNEYLIEWRRRREDLECDDLRDLPLPTPINCGIPRNLFGDAVSVMEFLHQFSSVLQVKNTFPSGFKLDLMEKALVDTDIQGPFGDLLQLLLLAVFKQQDVEEEEPDKIKESNFDNEENDDNDKSATVKVANSAAAWSIQNLGCIIRRFPLDPFTLTELLRLHLMASGADISTIASDRGGFKNIDDPGLSFKINNPHLVERLCTTPVFLFSSEERLKILTVLIEQLLTYPTFRNIIDKNIKYLKEARQELSILYKTRKSLLRSAEPSTAERENEKDPESILLNGENSEVPVLTSKEPHTMTEEEKAELAQFEQKVKELKVTINKIQKVFRLEPIGSDRAHRTYWIFNTIDGLFVEDSNPYANQCLAKPTPTHVTINGNLSQDEIPLSLMHKFLRIINNSHDKENNLSKSNKQSNTNGHKKMLSNLNGMSPLKPGSPDKKKVGRVVFGMCTANPNTCLVHGQNPNRITWGFFHEEKDLESIMNGLNSRGNREFLLRKSFLLEKTNVKESMGNCPVTKLNILSANSDEELQEQRKSLRLQAEKSPFTGIHPEEALESALRDAILDNEDKIWSGGLGAIKVEDRQAWRTAIENNSYSPQCDPLPDSDITPAFPVKLECSSIRLPAVKSEGHIQAASTSHSPSQATGLSPNIKDLARAVLQLALCVQTRYISEPLAAGEAYKRQLEKAAAEIERRKQKDEQDGDCKKLIKPVKIPKSPLDRWKESLLGCTSLSQLFLHLITLENSISWHRSALKASCKICRKRGDAENMLLCDKCDRGFHLYCLKPPLEEIPVGDWFCLACIPEPEEEEVVERKKRRTLNYKEVCSDDDEDEENSDYNSESASDSEDEEPQTKRSKRQKNNEDRNATKCKACHKGGELVSCSGCPDSLHLKCARPPLRRIPRGKWFCRKCVKSGKNLSQKEGSDSTSYNSRGSTDKRTSDPSDSSARNSRNSRRANTDLLDASSCEEILELLSKHQDSWPFKAKRKKADYKRIVKRPVDLTSIELKLKDGNYTSNIQFVADVYLMFQNCELTNSLQNEQEASKRLTRYFQTLLRRFKFEDANDVGDIIGRRPRRTF